MNTKSAAILIVLVACCMLVVPMAFLLINAFFVGYEDSILGNLIREIK